MRQTSPDFIIAKQHLSTSDELIRRHLFKTAKLLVPMNVGLSSYECRIKSVWHIVWLAGREYQGDNMGTGLISVYHKRRNKYLTYKEKGICCSCHSNKSVLNQIYCEVCKDKMAERGRKYHLNKKVKYLK